MNSAASLWQIRACSWCGACYGAGPRWRNPLLTLPARGGLRAIGVICAYLALAIASSGSSRAQAPASAPPSSEKHRMISRVVLSNTCGTLNVMRVSQKLDEVFPGKFVPLQQQANFVVDGPTAGQLLIKSTVPGAAGIFLLLNVARPYTDISGFTAPIADASLRRKVEAHACWLSVDLIKAIGTDADAYRFITAALAKLAPTGSTVLVNPDTRAMMEFNDDVRRQLASGELLP
jgi:hypothetical protein